MIYLESQVFTVTVGCEPIQITGACQDALYNVTYEGVDQRKLFNVKDCFSIGSDQQVCDRYYSWTNAS